MLKKLLTLGILAIVVGGNFAIPTKVSAQSYTCADKTDPQFQIGKPGATCGDGKPALLTTEAQTQNSQLQQQLDAAKKAGRNSAPTCGGFWNSLTVDCIGQGLAQAIGWFFTRLTSLALILSGYIFDYIVDATIINLTGTLGGESGLMESITVAWATLRDVGNMMFIFVLLYVAFQAMFSLSFGNVGKTITNIILVALLINFSLFFTKVVIDTSNIASVGFYKSVINNEARVPASGVQYAGKGISAGYMNMMRLQTFSDPSLLDGLVDGWSILTLGIVSSLFMLLTTVLLTIMSIMFAARFIILTLVMITSAVAMVALIIPGQQGLFTKWKDTLISQSFFAPLFFALTWVVFKIGNALFSNLDKSVPWSNITTEPQGVIPLLFNFVIITGLSVASLIFSKQLASKATGFAQISGGIGTGVIGGSAALGRNTVGRASRWISENKRDQLSKTAGGRALLWTANKGAKGSFDLRANDTLGKVPGLGKELGILGKAGGKGGINQAIKDKAKNKAAYAKEMYGKSGEEQQNIDEEGAKIDELKNSQEEKTRVSEARKASFDAAKQTFETTASARKTYMDNQTVDKTQNIDRLREQGRQKEREIQEARNSGKGSGVISQLEKEAESIRGSVKREEEDLQLTKKRIEENDAAYKTLADKEREADAVYKEARRKQNDKNISAEEYSQEIQNRIKNLDTLKGRAEKRMGEYADRVSGSRKAQTAVGAGLGAVAGGALGGPVGALVGSVAAGYAGRKLGELAGNRAASQAIRKAASKETKGKTEAEKIADALAATQKEEGKNKKEEDKSS